MSLNPWKDDLELGQDSYFHLLVQELEYSRSILEFYKAQFRRQNASKEVLKCVDDEAEQILRNKVREKLDVLLNERTAERYRRRNWEE